MAGSLIQLCAKKCVSHIPKSVYCLHSIREDSSKAATSSLPSSISHNPDERGDWGNEVEMNASTQISGLKSHLQDRLTGQPTAWTPPPHPFKGSARLFLLSEERKAKLQRQIAQKNYGKFGRHMVDVEMSSLWPSKEVMKVLLLLLINCFCGRSNNY